MLRFPRALPDRPLDPNERLQREKEDLRFQRQECRKRLGELKYGVAVVGGGGLAGLVAARRLVQCGVKVTVYEARKEVGGRVLSNRTFSDGRITEEGAELVGSFPTKSLGLARRSAHGRPKHFFDIADAISRILSRVEGGDDDSAEAVPALYTPAPGAKLPGTAMRTTITHRTAITGRDVKARKVTASSGGPASWKSAE